MKLLNERELASIRATPIGELIPTLIPPQRQKEIFKESKRETEPVLLGYLNNAHVVHAYYREAAQSIHRCEACGAPIVDRAYTIRDSKGAIDSEMRPLTICPSCLEVLPTERDRVALFEFLAFADADAVFTAQQLGTYLSCEPWRSPLFINGLIAAGDNVENFPPLADKGPVIRPQRQCDHPDQRFARGLMRRVLFDFRFGVVGDYRKEGLERLHSMNEEYFFNRHMNGPAQPDYEMVRLLKKTILSHAPITTKN